MMFDRLDGSPGIAVAGVTKSECEMRTDLPEPDALLKRHVAQ